MDTKMPHTAASEAPKLPPSRLYQRLEAALQQGQEISFCLSWGGLVGIPIYLDQTCVEIFHIQAADEEDEEPPNDEVFRRTFWLIRLEDISAIAFASEGWSLDRLDHLLTAPEQDRH
jgi:hypothetical protein